MLGSMSRSSKTQTAIIGAGPAGLMVAEVLAKGGAGVTVHDAMPSAGRKFLMAGRGGLNLTHSEALPEFLARYGEATPHLARAIDAFPPQALRDWSEGLGEPTFIGSSGRGFPHKRSRPRRCCARGCGGSTPWACSLRCATAGPAGRTMDGCRFRPLTESAWSMPARPCWRLAAQAGRGSGRTVRGPKRSPRRAWRYRG